ncbi:MAG: flavodoxin domain-containing protein [Anaerolineales bacterium]|nr:flavodoxin domain-containing protein [Anaerolineales bacterium]
MSTTVLVGYATRYGSTQEVAEAIAATFRECGLAVDVQQMREVRSIEGYGAAVLGAPLFMFRWHKDALGFLSRHRQALLGQPVAVFALGPVHNPHDEKEWQDSRDQLDKELAKFPWFKPVALEMFGGKYEPANLRFPLNKLAGKEPASDIRDWTAIRTWASDLPPQLEPRPPQASGPA